MKSFRNFLTSALIVGLSSFAYSQEGTNVENNEEITNESVFANKRYDNIIPWEAMVRSNWSTSALIQDTLDAKLSELDLSKVYQEGSEGYKLQSNLRIGTRRLMFNTHAHSIYLGIHLDKVEVIEYRTVPFDLALGLLGDVGDVFGDHPFGNVIKGRRKELAQKMSEEDPSEFALHVEYHPLVEEPIKSFENPHLNYNEIKDIYDGLVRGIENGTMDKDRIKEVAGFIPPEYRIWTVPNELK